MLGLQRRICCKVRRLRKIVLILLGLQSGMLRIVEVRILKGLRGALRGHEEFAGREEEGRRRRCRLDATLLIVARQNNAVNRLLICTTFEWSRCPQVYIQRSVGTSQRGLRQSLRQTVLGRIWRKGLVRF